MEKGVLTAVIIIAVMAIVIGASTVYLVMGDELLNLFSPATTQPVQETVPTQSVGTQEEPVPTTKQPATVVKDPCDDGHTVVVMEAIAPTCSAAGLSEGRYCSVCNLLIIEQKVLEKLPHEAVADAEIAATCTQTGLTEGSHCAVCNAVIVPQQTVNALGHTLVTDAAVAATCTQTGLTEGSHCSACGEVVVKQTVVNKAQHSMVTDPGREATCTQAGLTEGTHCQTCGGVGTMQTEIRPLGHSYSDWKTTKDPTCKATGTKTRSCSRCGDKETETLAKAAHTYSGGKCTVCKATQPASEGLTFALSDDGQSYVCTGWASYSYFRTKSVVVPATYNGKPVTEIGRQAFTGSDMEEIILPEGIKKLGMLAFYMCDNLKSIRIPDGITAIDGDVFASCGSLETVYISTSGWRYSTGIGTSATLDTSDPYEVANILRRGDSIWRKT